MAIVIVEVTSTPQLAIQAPAVEASGMTFGGDRGPAGASRGQLAMLAEQVIELLTGQTAE